MKGFRRRASVEEVLEAAGRVLAREVRALSDVPCFDRAAMDGYALRGEETFGASSYNPLALRIVGESRPCRPFEGVVGEGEAARIMTGAPLPAGADAVLPAEEAEEGEDRVRVLGSVPPKRHVSARGEDIRDGDLLLEAGRRLRPQDAAAASSTGWGRLPVWRRPRVAAVITGNELLPPGSRPDPEGARIVDSNSLLLAGLVRRDGGVPHVGEYVRDDPAAVEEALAGAASGADLVLVSGASSVGAEDHVPGAVAKLGEVLVHGIAMRPSGPAGFGLIDGRPIFLLPGNPVSCLCAYDFFAGPALRRRAGLPEPWPYPARTFPTARKIVSALGRVDYVRVRIEEGRVEPLTASGASILSSTVRAHGFVVVPAGLEGYAPGREVSVHLYDPPTGEGP